jgi:dolichol-phosphate mannosyltransferase
MDNVIDSPIPAVSEMPLNHPTDVRLAVVVPLASEGGTVTEFLRRVVEQLAPDDLVLCVLDNVSRDETRDKVEAFGGEEPRVRLVWAPENRSVMDAYFRGYREAVAVGARWILEMDGGMSHQPEEISRFVARIDDGYDYVVGCRFMPGGSHTGSLLRRSVSWGGSALARVALGTHMRDMTSGFEMFSRRAMDYVLSRGVQSRANFFQTEIKYMLRDWRWVEVPINYRSTNSRIASGSITEACRNLWRLRRRPEVGVNRP